jgi:hypothetical protein
MLRYYRTALISLFQDLNVLKTDPSNIPLSFSIQDRLISNISRTEFRINKLKEEIKDCRARIRIEKLPQDILNKLNNTIVSNNLKKDFYDKLLLIFRDIGDGIVFIYLEKWDIKPLVMSKEHAGFISGKKGIRFELKCFRYAKLRNIACIFNDITNSLRHGDLTLPMFGKPFLAELKSGNKIVGEERAKRQVARAGNIIKYLFDDIGNNIYPERGDETMHRVALNKAEINYQEKLTALVTEAIKSKNNNTVEIEKGLYYSIRVVKDEFENEFNVIPKTAEPYIFFANNFKKMKQGYYPFTLSISDPEALYKFYNGEYLITVFVDLIVVREELDKDGFILERLDDEHFCLKIKHKTEDIEFTISNHLFGRVGGEFLSPKWVIGEVFRIPPEFIETLRQ